LIEVRLHGRGGQGVVTAGRFIAEAAILEGRYAQSFPEFGTERSGAPISAYVRVNDEHIEMHCPIYHPNSVVVVDRSMAESMNTTLGLANDGTFICNFDRPPEELRTMHNLDPSVRVCALDATSVALKSIGKDYPNTPMLGALVKMTKIVSIDSMQEVMAMKFKAAVQASNAEALRLGYEGVTFA